MLIIPQETTQWRMFKHPKPASKEEQYHSINLSLTPFCSHLAPSPNYIFSQNTVPGIYKWSNFWLDGQLFTIELKHCLIIMISAR